MKINTKIENYVFDESTHKALFKLSSNNIITSIDSPISSGKEAITFLGHLEKTPLVAKIYKIETSKFKNMDQYIKGDFRFRNMSTDKRDMFMVWASKEFKNLTLALKYNVSCPVVIAREKNIIIMSFLGINDKSFPRLNEIDFDLDKIYPQLIDNYAKLLYGAKIVHADFSAFNILINPISQIISIIDMGQSVTYSHPKSKFFLKRDIINIVDFLSKKFPKIEITYDMFLEDLKKKKVELYGR
ncbi:MAG: AarF/UbiB family protein [Candidatus ainarchaeum sp.]|nr:AarF/UbiB family protein [Candidatus ainarchaeum sp.]MDD3975694.1 AarF/UbiB family protein [Candidatus ainarchaeum sp.]